MLFFNHEKRTAGITCRSTTPNRKNEGQKKERKILESSKTKQAMNYCLNRWENLTRYLDYSFLTPSTNEAERTVRPFTLLRKNSLFYRSGKGAESSCY
ncbi:IS66 family transposase [Treponema sp.]|uniref:IS66 family transposase n=1 Tax=Treponema sp. TaxID=166 RepID=UPI003FD88002